MLKIDDQVLQNVTFPDVLWPYLSTVGDEVTLYISGETMMGVKANNGVVYVATLKNHIPIAYLSFLILTLLSFFYTFVVDDSRMMESNGLPNWINILGFASMLVSPITLLLMPMMYSYNKLCRASKATLSSVKNAIKINI